jgi:hypothetical protein
MIISVALLGFGMSGAAITLGRRVLLYRVRLSMTVFALALTASILVSFDGMARVPLNLLELGWDARQLLHLFRIVLLCLLPFFLGACAIGLALAEPGARVGTRYAVNLVGTGLGSLGFVLLMHLTDVPGLVRVLMLTAGLSAVAFASSGGRRPTVLAAAAAAGVAGLSFLVPIELPVSQFKTLAYFQRLESQGDAATLERRFSPLGRIDVIDSPHVHDTPPGLSLNFTGELPPQRLMIFDGEGTSPVSRIDGDLDRAAFLDWTAAALPYRLLDAPGVALVGPGGGAPVLNALYHRASSVTAIELDSQIIALMRGPLREFSGGLYARPDVRVVCTEGRAFFETTDERFDLVELALVDSPAGAAAGTNALDESYLYTVEAFRTYLRRLEPRGILSITRWLKSRPVPEGTGGEGVGARMAPTDVARLLAGVAEALRSMSLDPRTRVVVIRSLDTATVLVRMAPFTPDELVCVRAFAQERSFDLVWLADLRPDEVNRFCVMPEPIYEDAARELLASPDRAEAFIAASPFAVGPATDDRPYFFHFFRWRLVGPLLRMEGVNRIPLVDWSYVALLATLALTASLGALLVLLPLLFVGRDRGATESRPRAGAPAVLVYFLCLGVAFMFLEMTTIQRMIRFLWHPVHSVAVVVTGFLVFAGIGSALGERLRMPPARKVIAAVIAVAAVVVLERLLLPAVLVSLARAPFALRVVVVLASIAPMALAMGVPFPTGLAALSTRRPALLPWAWGVNGCASVVATVLATLLAISFGFGPATWIALGAYVLAALMGLRFMGGPEASGNSAEPARNPGDGVHAGLSAIAPCDSS